MRLKEKKTNNNIRQSQATSEATVSAEPTRSSTWTSAMRSQAKLPMQTKLTVNQPGDMYEQEADQVANRVMRMPEQSVQRRCACGGIAGADGECSACKAKRLGVQHDDIEEEEEENEVLQTKRASGNVPSREAPASVHQTLGSSGQPLSASTRSFMEPRFGQDFSHVRVHTDAQAAQSAADVNAHAYTVGNNIVFGAGQYSPNSSGGQQLIAHELTHVIQQGNGTQPMVQRTVEMRDVGRGQFSGFARLPELIDRLNAMSTGVTYSVDANNHLQATLRPGGTLTNFDNQMIGFINSAQIIPLRLTNRHGLLGTHATGFHTGVDVDAWTSGYVDMDDLLASTDLGLQSVLVHFLRERSETRNYARRIGTTTFTNAEFRRVHRAGIDSEEQLLRDYFDDPTIRLVSDSPSATVRRAYRNSRGDLIRRRVHHGQVGDQRGVDAMRIDVRLRDGTILTAEQYRAQLQAEQAAREAVQQAEVGAAEHWAGGAAVPAP